MSGLEWRKSSFSSGVGGQDCVEVATTPNDRIHIRESDDPAVVIATRPTPWGAFVRGGKAGGLRPIAGKHLTARGTRSFRCWGRWCGAGFVSRLRRH
ncbi:DUF397 domain-containing protein [Streptomyces sp. NPDC127074]|uniref:DUF397 domain-containing protein n=1 Tax=Streptomyces sp. NPDC127074 TaxID=3347130 RepID=UPI003669FB41